MSSKTAKKKTAKTKKGKRYSAQEKADILSFVNKINSEKGRGGQSTASKKYKISPLTISSWLKKAGAPSAPKARGRRAVAKTVSTATTAGPIGKKLAKLQALHNQIERSEKELTKLRAQFNALKGSL